jgi:hypothetical protein
MGYETISIHYCCYNPLLRKANISKYVQLEKDIYAYTNKLKLMAPIKQQVQVKMKMSLCSHLNLTKMNYWKLVSPMIKNFMTHL